MAAGDVLGTGERDIALADVALALPPDDLARAFDFAGLARFCALLEARYGARGGRSVALRIGRAWLDAGLGGFGLLAGLSDPAFQALPAAERARLGLEALAVTFNRHSDQRCVIADEADHYLLIVHDSPMAWGRQAEAPVCHALAGLIQETLYRTSNNRSYYHVIEQSCRAAGGESCIFSISKKPMGKQ